MTVPGEKPTPDNYNKEHRDATKVLLAGASVLLLSGYLPVFSMLLSGGATLMVKQGTKVSAKNWKWMALSCITFFCSAMAWHYSDGYQRLDKDEAMEEEKFAFWSASKKVEKVWGAILFLFMASAYADEKDSLLSKKLAKLW